MTYDLYLGGKLLAQDLLATTVEDLCKLDAEDIATWIEEAGVCTALDASGERELDLVAHTNPLPGRALC